MSGPAESRAFAAALDNCTIDVLRCLVSGGILDGPAVYSPDAYAALARRVDRLFRVPRTSITTAAARLLFGVAETLRPRTVAALGSYYGNSLIWLAGPALDDPAAPLERAIGCDLDAKAVAGARRNLLPLDDDRVQFRHQDAREFLREAGPPIDILLIDTDDPRYRKRPYAELLRLALPRLAPGALVLAHDRYEEVFQDDFQHYLDIVRDPSLFAVSAGVPIDDAGFEISRARGGQP